MFEEMFDEFDLMLPHVSQALFWSRDTGLPWLGVTLVVCCVFAGMLRLVSGRARWQRLRDSIPLIGPLWYWSGVAEWTSLMGVLLKHQLRLPDALRLAGHGTRNEHIGQVSQQLADGVSRGRKLTDLMRANCQIPATLVPLVHWGETTSAFDESFRVGSELFQRRVQTRATMVTALVPPLLFVGIGCCVLFVVFGAFLPLLDLVSALS
jgi:type II secretory pathway component PulF